MIRKMKEHPVLASIGIAVAGSALSAVLFFLLGQAGQLFGRTGGFSFRISQILRALPGILLIGAMVGAFCVYPIMLTFINFAGVFRAAKSEEDRRVEKRFEWITLVLGTLYTMLFFTVTEIQLDAHWSEQLYNSQVHQPIWSEAAPTVIVLCVVGVLGYLILSGIGLKKLPPLVTVLSISAMYLGIAVCVVWMIHTISRNWVLSVFPVNCIFIAVKTIRYKITEWNQREEHQETYSGNSFLQFANRILQRAELWPVLALVLMWPLLGILLVILVLFGQRPDAIIKAFTETADWTLSQQVAPQNAMFDEHYLCTVAAGGHENVVKPLRMGQRHGHRVVVNRQLCIANAFEQILEERTPKFHRAVRHFYDTYGFPVSRLIRTKGAADVVYVLMKPLEWVFLCVIYLCDAKPENRIAVQYLPFSYNSIKR